jgi:hypothetical protein
MRAAKTIPVFFGSLFPDPTHDILKNTQWTDGTAVDPAEQGCQDKDNNKTNGHQTECGHEFKNRRKKLQEGYAIYQTFRKQFPEIYKNKTCGQNKKEGQNDPDGLQVTLVHA